MSSSAAHEAAVPVRNHVAKVFLAYLVIGSLWILFSDWLVSTLGGMVSPEFVRWQSAKGLFYVLGTAAILAVWLHRHLRQRRKIEDSLIRSEAEARTQAEVLKRTLEAARREEMKRSRLFASAPDPLLILGTDGCIQDANPAWGRLMGWNPEEYQSRPFLEFVQPEDRIVVEGVLAGLRADDAVQFESRSRCQDGTHRWLSWNALSLAEEGLIFLAGRDQTLSRSLEAQLQQAQKMESISRLSAGISHDFKNFLTVISAESQLLQLGLSAQDPAYQALGEIEDAARRAAELANRLSILGRERVVEPTVVNLTELVRGMRDLVQRVILENVRLELVLQNSPLAVRCDRTEMEQVLLNLCINAKDAMPKGGTLSIRISETENAEGRCAAFPLLPAGHYVILEVEDTGTGMPPEVQSRIFEPFFTTKLPGQGTGLGLPTVYAIVQRTGGQVLVESEVGIGTCFRILLPKSDEGASEGRAAVSGVPTGHETVLVVDDDPALHRIISRLVSSWGYTALSAETPAEALAICREYPRPIHLLVTDLMMPVLSGVELARMLRELRPELQVLYISGYGQEILSRHEIEARDANFLAKPFERGALAVKIREVLDLRSPAA